MATIVRWITSAFADRPRVMVCESCGSLCACDTACRAGAARDRALTAYVNVAGYR